jgi:NAD(P)-dependent dehydrogenase (short-subunit alcohol dehydrogenase family)
VRSAPPAGHIQGELETLRAQVELVDPAIIGAVAALDDAIADMHGQVVLVTGATAGIGFHVAAALARKGARVLLTGRSDDRGHAAVARIRSSTGSETVDFLAADGSLVTGSVTLAREVRCRTDRLDVLVNNVGGICHRLRAAPQGEAVREGHLRVDAAQRLIARGSEETPCPPRSAA